MPESLWALLVMGRSVGSAVAELETEFVLASEAAARVDVDAGVEGEMRAAASLDEVEVEVEKVVESVDVAPAGDVLLPSVAVD